MKKILMLLCCCALSCGCYSRRVISSTRRPEIEIDELGRVTLNGETVKRGKVAKAARAAGFMPSQEINILIPDRPDRSVMASVAGELVQGGYQRTIFVKTRRAGSSLQPLDESQGAGARKAPRK